MKFRPAGVEERKGGLYQHFYLFYIVLCKDFVKVLVLILHIFAFENQVMKSFRKKLFFNKSKAITKYCKNTYCRTFSYLFAFNRSVKFPV